MDSVSIIAMLAAAAAAASVCLVGVLVSARRRRRRDRVVLVAVAELAAAVDREAVGAVAGRAVTELLPPGSRPGFRVAASPSATTVEDAASTGLVPIRVESGAGTQLGALQVDPATAARSRLRPALQVVSAQAALALERLRLTELAAWPGDPDLAAVIEQSADVVLIVNDDDRITYASPSARIRFGEAVLDGTRLLELVDPAERRTAGFLLRHARAGSGDPATGVSRADWTVTGRDGRRLQVEAMCRPLRTGGGASGGVVVALRDVTALRRLEREMTRRVFHDPLTGLPNRLSFRDRIDQAIATQTARTAVLLINIDDFRTINEGVGHDGGDTVLTAVGQRIDAAVGDGAVAARLGDDEFAVLMRDVTDREPDEAAARIAEALVDPIPVAAGSVSCTVCVGIATSASAHGAPELLRHANLALRAAKAAGRGQRRRYRPSMADALGDRVALRAALGRAIHEGSLSVDYQPIVALETGSVVGFEALLRWWHPVRGRLHPSEFIDVAEESGLIVPIGERVLETALYTATKWPRSPAVAPYVSVNVSVHQLRSTGFIRTVDRLLAASGLPPDRLVLELTETQRVRDHDAVWEDLQRLRRSGVRVAIDDFGTGYSTLSYLRHLPLDLVKLDRLFISPLTASPRQRELVEGIVRLARSLNLEVVAEGIETTGQRDILTQIGCAYGQGHLFGRPAPDPARPAPPG